LTGLIAGMAEGVSAVALVRRDRSEAAQLLTGLGEAFAAGTSVDWAALFVNAGARRVDLPTYPFQRQRYWLPARSPRADLAAAGIAQASHPLLTAIVTLPDSDGKMLSGRLSSESPAWLAEHELYGRVFFPAAALPELVLHAGGLLGWPTLRDLRVEAPMVMPTQGRGGLALRVIVGSVNEGEIRPVSVYSGPDSGEDPWTQHAVGTLSRDDTNPDASSPAEWPPSSAMPIDIDSTYAELAALGFDYGPKFRCVTEAWRRGEETFVELTLPDDLSPEGFGLHPALLDAALHCHLLDASGDAVHQPSGWTGVSLHAEGATRLRVRIAQTEPGLIALHATDADGQPVLSIASLATSPISVDRLDAHSAADAVFALTWVDVSVNDDVAPLPAWDDLSETVPPAVLFTCPKPSGDVLAGTRETTRRMLEVLQSWLADPRYDDSQLVVLTERAADVADSGVDLSQAAVWGLVRAAQSENPGRFVLVDVEPGSTGSIAAIAGVVAAGEPQAAVRGKRVLVPRLVRAVETSASASTSTGPTFGEQDTVLITGGTGGLGAAVARHLVTVHGVRELVLASRRGAEAPGAVELHDELSDLGANVTVAACDLSDRAATAALLDRIPGLTGIVHTAGILDDGVINALTPARLDSVLAAKADSAWHLHELTQHHKLKAFVLFSSIAGTLGGPGQGNYAAANAFLDALAAHRHAMLLPAQSFAWGPWTTGMVDSLSTVGRSRLRQQGIAPLDVATGLALFDLAQRHDSSFLTLAALDLPAMGRTDSPPAVLRGLVRVRPRVAADRSGLKRRMAGLSAPERLTSLLELVRAHAAGVLGHPTTAAIEPQRAFKELGFDSLGAVRFRNGLAEATGLGLPTTLLYDYPTARAVAEHLAAQLEPSAEDASHSLLSELDRLAAALAAVDPGSSQDADAKITARLEALLRGWQDSRAGGAHEEPEQDYGSATDDELFAALDSELGVV